MYNVADTRRPTADISIVQNVLLGILIQIGLTTANCLHSGLKIHALVNNPTNNLPTWGTKLALIYSKIILMNG